MSFFKSIETWVGKLFKSAPKATTIALSTIHYVAPLLETILALADPALEPVVAAVVDKVQVGLAAAAATISAGGDGTSLTAILESVKTNLSSLLTAGQIKNPDTLKRVQGIVNTIIGEVEAIQASVPAK